MSEPKTWDNGFSANRTEVDEIIGKVPRSSLRWGFLITLICFAVVVLMASTIRYPVRYQATIRITTNPQPVEVHSTKRGRLIIVKNNTDTIKKNELIAYLESEVDIQAILSLEEILRQSAKQISATHIRIFADTINSNLGELQIAVNNFLNELDASHNNNRNLQRKTKTLDKNSDFLQLLLDVRKWKIQNTFISPINGWLICHVCPTNDMSVSENQLLFSITPPVSTYVGLIELSGNAISDISSGDSLEIRLEYLNHHNLTARIQEIVQRPNGNLIKTEFVFDDTTLNNKHMFLNQSLSCEVGLKGRGKRIIEVVFQDYVKWFDL